MSLPLYKYETRHVSTLSIRLKQCKTKKLFSNIIITIVNLRCTLCSKPLAMSVVKMLMNVRSKPTTVNETEARLYVKSWHFNNYGVVYYYIIFHINCCQSQLPSITIIYAGWNSIFKKFKQFDYTPNTDSKSCSFIGGVAQWLARRSFGWQTFPNLCLIYGWHVTTSWVSCLLWVSLPGQLSSNPCNFYVALFSLFRDHLQFISFCRSSYSYCLRHVGQGCNRLVK